MGYSLKYEDIVIGSSHALGAAVCALVGGAVFGGVRGVEPVALFAFAITSGGMAGAIGVGLHRWRTGICCPHQLGLWGVGVSVLCYPFVLTLFLLFAGGFPLKSGEPLPMFFGLLVGGFVLSAWAVMPVGYLSGWLGGRMIVARAAKCPQTEGLAGRVRDCARCADPVALTQPVGQGSQAGNAQREQIDAHDTVSNGGR